MARNIAFFAVALFVAAALHFLMWARPAERPVRPFAPLSLAVRRGDIDAVRRLLEEGADPNEISGESGDSALGRAVERCAMESRFWPTPARLGANPQTYLLYTDIVRTLLARGADVNVGHQMWSGSNIGTAVVSGDLKLLEILAAHGRAAKARNWAGQTPLFDLERGSGEVYQERSTLPDAATVLAMAQLLVREGVRVDAQDGEGQTALHEAARAGRINAVRALVECGADVNVRDKDGLTALDCARTVAIEEVLRKAGGKGLGE